MLKPVSILALDDPSAMLAEAVQRRIAAACGLDDLVQWRAAGDDLTGTIASIHARRQSPGNPLRLRDDISTRELVLLVFSAGGPARPAPESVIGRTGPVGPIGPMSPISCMPAHTMLDIAREVRQLYDMRRLAEFYTVEALCLLPDVLASGEAQYGAAYSMLKLIAADNPFDAVWLLDATNGNRVRFGSLDNEAYADAVAGALTFEPELSGALTGAFRPRGMEAAFSSFGYAELVFPRDVALQRVEPRFAAELLRAKLLTSGAATAPQLAAKQLVVGDEFAVPLSRIGVDAGQSLFMRFQPKTFVTERTRSADEVIAAVRGELQAHRDRSHLQNLEALQKQGEQTTTGYAALLARVVDETLDRGDYPAAIALLDALLDPLPDLHAGTDVAPRNLVTEINAATAALDVRLRFTPDTAASDAARKRIRELDDLLSDQKLVADTLTLAAHEQLAELEREKEALTRRVPELLFAEEAENNAARNAARDAEAARLAEETQGREERLRELFAQLPRAEQELREALEARRSWLWQQLAIVAAGMAALWFVRWTIIPLAAFVLYAAFRYITLIAPRVRAAREQLQRLRELIQTADKSKNAAHNDELQFEYDVAHRRTTLSVLRRTREYARGLLDAIRTRYAELEALAQSFAPASIAGTTLSIAIIDDADVDAWYERTADDRKLLFREFPIARSQSRVLPLEDVRRRLTDYAATAFDDFRKLTIANAAALTTDTKLAQRLKRFTEYAAPLIELRDDDLPAQQAMQRDTTLWLDPSDARFVATIQRRLPDAVLRPPADPLRIPAVSRVLHYPAYVLGQIEFYGAQYDPTHHPESADVPDLLPTEFQLTPPVRAACEQLLLARALGVIPPDDALLLPTPLLAAQRLATTSGATVRQDLETALAPKLAIAKDVEHDLRDLLVATPALSALERNVVEGLIRRYGV